MRSTKAMSRVVILAIVVVHFSASEWIFLDLWRFINVLLLIIIMSTSF